MEPGAFELTTHGSIREIGQAAWSSLLGQDSPPFLCFEWLDALERTGCVEPERGWAPMHLTLRQNGKLVAAAPAYVKGNSEGEFVFDHSWARFCEAQLGIDYFPKLVVAVPFTPATGPRLLIAAGAPRPQVTAAFAEGLRQLTAKIGASSAHVLFPFEDESNALAEHGFAERYGLQFHWRNAGYATFDDFLGSFNSKRRNQVRRERREMEDRGIEIFALTGGDLTLDWVDFIYDFYRSTVNKFYWGRQYLNRHFFEEVCSTMPDKLHVVVARERAGGKCLAGAFNLLGSRALYGRYWGALHERPFLHFNVCFYFGIEECVRRGLVLFEPGAGGEHKQARGFEPAVTHSAHHLADPRLDRVVRDFLKRERAAVREHVREAEAERVARASSQPRR